MRRARASAICGLGGSALSWTRSRNSQGLIHARKGCRLHLRLQKPRPQVRIRVRSESQSAEGSGSGPTGTWRAEASILTRDEVEEG